MSIENSAVLRSRRCASLPGRRHSPLSDQTWPGSSCSSTSMSTRRRCRLRWHRASWTSSGGPLNAISNGRIPFPIVWRRLRLPVLRPSGTAACARRGAFYPPDPPIVAFDPSPILWTIVTRAASRDLWWTIDQSLTRDDVAHLAEWGQAFVPDVAGRLAHPDTG